MLNIENLINTQIEIKNGVWVTARPIVGCLTSRIKDAWQVVIGNADAVKFIGQ